MDPNPDRHLQQLYCRSHLHGIWQNQSYDYQQEQVRLLYAAAENGHSLLEDPLPT